MYNAYIDFLNKMWFIVNCTESFDNLEKARINVEGSLEIIAIDDYDELMDAISYKMREIYRR